MKTDNISLLSLLYLAMVLLVLGRSMSADEGGGIAQTTEDDNVIIVPEDPAPTTEDTNIYLMPYYDPNDFRPHITSYGVSGHCGLICHQRANLIHTHYNITYTDTDLRYNQSRSQIRDWLKNIW